MAVSPVINIPDGNGDFLLFNWQNLRKLLPPDRQGKQKQVLLIEKGRCTMKTRLLVYLVLVALLFSSGCQARRATPTAPTEAPTSPAADVTETPTSAPVILPGKRLPIIMIDWTKPFAGKVDAIDDITPGSWSPTPYQGQDLPLPFAYDLIANDHVIDNLTADQKNFLSQNGFAIIHSQEAQFGDIRVETANRSGQPYYLTTDAAYHALHLLFDDMLKTIEGEYFRTQMMDILQATLREVISYIPHVKGTSIEAETRQAVAYLSVALKLFDQNATIEADSVGIVSQQVEQIMKAAGRGDSALFPDFEDDYGAYKPVGHYAGDPILEAYFRGMTWFGRTHFLLQKPDDPSFVPSRLPLIVTHALRSAMVGDQAASDIWASMHEILTFVIGPSDDPGPLEYAILMDNIYGDQATIQDLADDTLWQKFLSSSNQLPAPQINSLFVDSTVDLSAGKGWRFMGQRFTLDGFILQNLIFDRVQPKPDGTRREMPSGLDVMATFGSTPALMELDAMGTNEFPNYQEQLIKMVATVQDQTPAQWLGRFYDGWLYSFLPVVRAKGDAFPSYMQTKAWSYKDLNSGLGSWAELKHDTILYTKMPEGAGGGGPPMSEPAASYVEPNPPVFYRMGTMAKMLSCGLQERLMQMPCTSQGYFDGTAGGYILAMYGLGNRLETLGDIAVKELSGEALTQDENYAITSCLGLTECLNLASPYSIAAGEMPKVPVIAAVSGAGDSVLEVGVGNVDRIYVVVPLENKWQIAQGGVFSYYEFTQPRSQRLTDDAWRDKLAKGEVTLPAWASKFMLSGGEPLEWLYFRIGDIYYISDEGNNLNMRDAPSRNGAVLQQLTAGTYIEIVDGPMVTDGDTWWQIKCLSCGDESPGWVIENQEWYLRSYYQ
ncbi:DUF3160 domain-containing protein [Chloroflexota bacterium]